MITFADSSAIVKLYVDEEGHRDVRRLGLLVVSSLARVEVPSAFWRKQRAGQLSVEDAEVLTGAFEADYFGTPTLEPRFVAVAPTDVVLDQAARMAATHGLRAYDAVQLASAVAARGRSEEAARFAAFDRHLRVAATDEGFLPVPTA